ncbi:MAG TPA: glycoside hydrolase family 38 C-terminal domain-containing protein [Verrucomicrobiae bacterium]|nr:glycoside hydrolase family 38 C-terminal domain-containing protein [Verrucomicrobiae bacterium]
MRTSPSLLLSLCLQWLCAATAAEPTNRVIVVPNFHPASCGWLANWSVERNYCANSYLDHLDRVRDDATYGFAISEVNNMMAILAFRPERFEELKARIREGRAEPCNAFFLEPTINLSGGEALVKCGIEGLRWQQKVLGFRPRLAWMIDVTGMHEQMAQIAAGLGLDGFAYCRHNPTGYAIHWAESPDGARSLAVAPGAYADWRELFKAPSPLDEKALDAILKDIQLRADPRPLTVEEIQKNYRPSGGEPRRMPAGAPVLVFGGSGDYNLAPLCKGYPAEFLRQFKQLAPQLDVEFSTPGRYLDAVLPGIRSGSIPLTTMRGGTAFNYNSFWIQNPRVKTWFRRCEQDLQAAEMLGTIASLKGGFAYPVMPLYHAWLLMCLNMDRNTLWGAAGGMVFEHPTSWDAKDRFEWVEKTAADTSASAIRALRGKGEDVALFNPLNWERNDPVEIPGHGLCRPTLPSIGIGAPAPADKPADIPPPATIETQFYSLRIDPATGAITSLKLKPSKREVLGGPANVIVAEKSKKPNPNTGDHMANREDRESIANSNALKPTITAQRGEFATTLQIRSEFIGGGAMFRTVRCYDDYPRIDFETELNDIPDPTVVVAEFPLAEDIAEVRRGIPYGFSHGAWASVPPIPASGRGLTGWTKGIVPAVRWSHYQMAGGTGIALLDRGLSGRELTGRTPVIFLLNTSEKYRGYPNSWLSGKGKHQLSYALVAHDAPWPQARIPQMAWEYNCPPIATTGVRGFDSASFVQTSDNMIVEAMRREGQYIELRLAECLGLPGNASVTLSLPHDDAAITDMTGAHAKSIGGTPTCEFPVRPQQIMTLRFKTKRPVAEIEPLLKWDELVPPNKLEALRQYLPDVKGHPPAGS